MSGRGAQNHLDAVLDELSRWPEGTPPERLRWFLEQALRHARADQRSYRLYLSLALQPATQSMVLEEVERRPAGFAVLDRDLTRIFSALGHQEPDTEALVVRATVDGLIQYLLMAPDDFPIEEAVSRMMVPHGAHGSGARR